MWREFLNSIEIEWKKFLKSIMTEGKEHTKDDGDKLKESLINHCFIENVITSKYGENQQYITTETFLNMIKEGEFNINDYPVKDIALYDYVTSIDDTETILNINLDGSKKFTYTYPERIFHMTEDQSNITVNQFDVICSRLKISKGSNRAVANIYSAPLDFLMKDIPCLQILQATIRDDELILHCFFRSNDCYGAFPSNMLFLNYLGLKIVDNLKEYYPSLKFKGINYNSSSLHVYEGDWEQAEKII